MRYINTFLLIKDIISGKKPDAKEFLAGVNREEVLSSIRKTKAGLPQPFKVTWEPVEEENFAKLPRSAKTNLMQILEKLPQFAGEQLPALLELKEKFPNVPLIHNYLGLAYAYTGQMEKHFQTISETAEKFPRYFFAKIALAEYYLNRNEHQKVPGIFDNKFELYQHFPPNTPVFHISEARAFYSIIGIYYARANKLPRALLCFFTLESIDPDHAATQRLADEIILKEIEKLMHKIKPKKTRR